jgi:hypothetical protein
MFGDLSISPVAHFSNSIALVRIVSKICVVLGAQWCRIVDCVGTTLRLWDNVMNLHTDCLAPTTPKCGPVLDIEL